MRWILITAFLLAGCQSKAQKAERAYEIVDKGGTDMERCEAGKKASAAWLDEGNEEKYREWKLHTDTICLLVQARGDVR